MENVDINQLVGGEFIKVQLEILHRSIEELHQRIEKHFKKITYPMNEQIHESSSTKVKPLQRQLNPLFTNYYDNISVIEDEIIKIHTILDHIDI